MKSLTVSIIAIILTIDVSGYLIKVPTVPDTSPSVTSKPQRVLVQKLIIPLFENVCEPSSDPTIQRLAEDFAIDPNDYLSPRILRNFEELKSNGLLAKGTIITEYNINHLFELRIMFELLYSATNFDTFYKTAAWARQNMNCVSYMNAIYLAILNRKDTEDVLIPAPYELLPHYFVVKDVILQATSILNGNEVTLNESIRFEGNSYTIDTNYTAAFFNNEEESMLAYFREDIGLNSYHYLRKLRMAPWMNNNVNSNFGENMYQMMKQLMARYDLERYANGLPETNCINWNSSVEVLYDPLLTYTDGNEFGHRTLPIDLPQNEDLIRLKAIENDVTALVSHMHQSGYNKTHILNHLMEIFVTGDRSYETLARQYLGKDLASNSYPSVLEHYLTSMRDPIFWQINKRIVELIDEALKVLPPYERNELYFPGVEIINIDVKKMMTSYDYFEFGVTDALKTASDNSTFNIKLGQPRLNHKKFTIKVNISSILPQKGLMKIYLGPNLKPGALMKNLFTLLDVSEVNLKSGTNIITRSSDNMNQFSDDFVSINTMRRMVDAAEFGLDSLPLRNIQSQIGYPSRLILPKGIPQGLPLQMFVFIAPYLKRNIGDVVFGNSLEFNSALLSPGYPLDLIIENQKLFGLPNSMTKTVTVTQKSDNVVENYDVSGATKPWYSYKTNNSLSYNEPKDSQYKYNKNKFTISNKFNIDHNSIIPDGIDNLNVVGLNDSPAKLKTSNFDYSSKHAVPFDYKAKKAQYKKTDVSYEKYRKKANTVEEIASSTSANTNIVFNGQLMNNISHKSNDNTDNVIDETFIDDMTESQDSEMLNQQIIYTEPFPLSTTTKKTTDNEPSLSVYNFLDHVFNLDSNTKKVYE